MLVKIAKYIGFCVYRRSYLLWSPVIVGLASNFNGLTHSFAAGGDDRAGGFRTNCTYSTYYYALHGGKKPPYNNKG